ncbi:MAG: zinc ABC transporter substrate-binding protein [Castellaniella sp.]
MNPTLNPRRWLAGLLVLVAMAAPGVPAQAQPLRVVASFSVLGDLVRAVGGDDIVLDVLVGPNRDPHSWEPSPQAVQHLARADVLIENGLGFETWMGRLVASSGFAGQRIVASAGVTPLELADTGDHDHDHHDHGGHDPHAWQDVRHAMRYVENIAAGLAAADAGKAAAYRDRADRFLAELAALDAELRARFAALSGRQLTAITGHQAFGYAGAAWGIAFLSAAGLSSDAEPSAREVAALIDLARDAPGRVGVFIEKGSHPRLVRQLAREAGVTVAGPLYSDALDAPGHAAGSYMGMMRWNADQLLLALD